MKKNEEKKSNGMTILILVAIVVIIVALFLPGGEVEPKSQLQKISYEEYKTLLSEPSNNVILIARPTCGFCVKFIPILEKIESEYGIKINYFDTDALSKEDSEEFYSSNPLYSSDEFGTPTLIITKNNEITKYSIGYKEKEDAVKWLKENGMIIE